MQSRDDKTVADKKVADKKVADKKVADSKVAAEMPHSRAALALEVQRNLLLAVQQRKCRKAAASINLGGGEDKARRGRVSSPTSTGRPCTALPSSFVRRQGRPDSGRSRQTRRLPGQSAAFPAQCRAGKCTGRGLGRGLKRSARARERELRQRHAHARTNVLHHQRLCLSPAPTLLRFCT